MQSETNMYFLSISKMLSIILILLLLQNCSSIDETSSREKEISVEDEKLTAEEKYQLLVEQVEGWTKAEPNVERILSLESDMQLIIEQLSLLADIDDNPLEIEQQDDSNEQKEKISFAEKKVPPKNINGCASHLSSTSRSLGHCSPKIGIHVAAFEDSANIKRGWEYLQSILPEELSEKKPLIKKVATKDKIYQSLRLGPFSSANAANALCSQLRAKNHYCSVVEYKGQPII